MKPFGSVFNLFLSVSSRLLAMATAMAMLPCIASTRTATHLPENMPAHLPLFFETGPAPSGSVFSAHTPGCVIQIAPTEATLLFRGSPVRGSDHKPVWSHTIRMQLAGANPAAKLNGDRQLTARANYLLGKDSNAWQAGAPLFAQVKAENVYPGIDVVYYGNGERLEYDFVVSPGTDPSIIRFEVKGADRLSLAENGDLLLSFGTHEMCQHKPVVYQTKAGAKVEVSGAYRVQQSTVSFELGDYDPTLPLVIDPVFSFSTYVGGISQDAGWDIATDQNGNVYITGETLSPWLATPGAFRPYFSGGSAATGGDAFVAKFDPSGSRLIYLTYLGGTGNDAASALAVDGDGAVYVTGVTDSTDFPLAFPIKWFISGTASPYIPLYPYDAFVCKLDASGSKLVYSTYLGGSGTDQGMDIAVDSDGSAYVTGFTQSGDFPRSATSRKYAGKGDAFISKLIPTGRNFAYSIFLGGTSVDRAHGIVVDAARQATIVGYTESARFPLTNAVQEFRVGGKDAFIATVSRDGSRLIQSTYWGGLGDDIAYDVALDQVGNLHVTGTQSGQGFPITPGSLNPGGVFRSLSAGADWSAVNAGLLHTDVRSIAISPSDPAIVYMDTWRGIYRSSDAGQNWTLALPGSVRQPRSIAIDPGNPNLVYATAGFEILVSTNGGDSWAPKGRGLPDSKASKLIISPESNSVLYAATGLGVYRSTNSGASFRFSSRGIGARSVGDLAVGSADPSVLFASTSAGVYRSTNYGDSWFKANKGLGTTTLGTLALDPQEPLTVYGGKAAVGFAKKPGLFKTVNGGTNWFALPFLGPSTNLLATNLYVTAVAVDPGNSQVVYAGSARGLFQSLNGGTNWIALTNGLSVSNIAVIALNPQNPATLFAGTTGSSSFGASDAFLTRFGPGFLSASFGGKSIDQPLAVAADAQGNSFVAGTTASRNFPTSAPGSALSSTNRGGYDAFVTIINAEGSGFVYSGYLGGRGSDRATGITVDPAGNAAIVGRTTSLNFPVSRPFRSTLTGGSDAFITRLLSAE